MKVWGEGGGGRNTHNNNNATITTTTRPQDNDKIINGRHQYRNGIDEDICIAVGKACRHYSVPIATTTNKHLPFHCNTLLECDVRKMEREKRKGEKASIIDAKAIHRSPPG